MCENVAETIYNIAPTVNITADFNAKFSAPDKFELIINLSRNL